MPDATSAEHTTIFFLGSDTELFDGLHDRLRDHRIQLRGFRTIAGMMLASEQCSVPVLLLELQALQPGRDPMAVVARLEDAAGLRPLLVCLGPAKRCAGMQSSGVAASFSYPYDIPLMVTTLLDLAGTRSAGERRALVIGDSPVEQGAVARVLHHARILARVVGSGEDVGSIVEQFRPHLVLLDLDTSAGTGRELASRIRDCDGCERLPIVFVSGDSPLEHRVDALRIGGDDYLVKPVSSAALLQTIEDRIGTGIITDTTTAGGLSVMDWNAFRRRLDRAVRQQGDAGPGDAVLAIGLDHRPGPDALPTWRNAVESELVRFGQAKERAAWSSDQEIVLWLRRESGDAVAEAAEAIRTALSRVSPEGADAPRGSVSIGIASFRDRADNAPTMISRAQAAEAQARGLGGDRVMQHVCTVESVLIDETPEETQNLDETLLPLLKRAIDDHGFQLVYQPIVPLRRTGRHRYEALLRLRTPTGAIIPPLTFLPVASRHGLLPALDRWVLSNALAALRQEREVGHGTLVLIHQTSDSLVSPDWLDWVRSEILRLDLVRQRPVIEVTAAAVLANESAARDVFPALDRLGIETCLTGVGDDPAVKALLTRNRVDFVKLERSLIAADTKVDLRSVVKGFHKGRIKVIATGIEDPEAIGRAWSSGVDYIQGNFIQFPEETLNFNFDELPLRSA